MGLGLSGLGGLKGIIFPSKTTGYSDNFNRPDGPIQSPWGIIDYGGFQFAKIQDNQLKVRSTLDFNSSGNDQAGGAYKALQGNNVSVVCDNDADFVAHFQVRESMIANSNYLTFIHTRHDNPRIAYLHGRDPNSIRTNGPANGQNAKNKRIGFKWHPETQILDATIDGVIMQSRKITWTPNYVVLGSSKNNTVGYEDYIEV